MNHLARSISDCKGCTGLSYRNRTLEFNEEPDLLAQRKMINDLTGIIGTTPAR
jgi:hypothetical protein